jgi:hypothetical protein
MDRSYLTFDRGDGFALCKDLEFDFLDLFEVVSILKLESLVNLIIIIALKII